MIADGITVVVAAGNESTPSCSVTPARVRDAITVAASDVNDVRAYFSNYGSCNDLYAQVSTLVRVVQRRLRRRLP